MRVLHVISSFGRGGAPALIVNYMQNMPGKDVVFDFLLRSNNNAYESEIEKCGGRVYKTDSFPKHVIRNFFQTKKFIQEHSEYQVIHIHCNALIYIIPALLAKKMNRCVIIHSHNTMAESKIGTLIHAINKKNIDKYSDYRFACSDIAGRWCFDNEYMIIKNAVNPEQFFEDVSAKIRIREFYNIQEKNVYIHVGRFEKQKNHEFLIEIFNEIVREEPASVLFLVGAGSLEESIKCKVMKMGLSDKVIFTGVIQNVNDYLSAADVMIFPSFWEGLPVSLIEAQYASLKVFCSTNISEEVLASPYIQACDLAKSAKTWAKEIIEFKNKKIFDPPHVYLDRAGYNIQVEAQKLKDFYMKQQESMS